MNMDSGFSENLTLLWHNPIFSSISMCIIDLSVTHGMPFHWPYQAQHIQAALITWGISCQHYGNNWLFCWWLIWPILNDAKKLKLIEALALGYSSESTLLELSKEYQHDRVLKTFQIFCLIRLTKIASASKGLIALQIKDQHLKFKHLCHITFHRSWIKKIFYL